MSYISGIYNLFKSFEIVYKSCKSGKRKKLQGFDNNELEELIYFANFKDLNP